MYESFKKIVENIFNNWTALHLAVEHNMGGTDSKQIVIAGIDDLAKYCTDYQVEVTDIEDQLEDFMDQQLNTSCEDGSIKDIANLLFRFLQLLQENNLEQVEIEYNQLPKNNKQWLTQQQQQQQPNCSRPVEDELRMEDSPVDSEWTEVKSRKKR